MGSITRTNTAGRVLCESIDDQHLIILNSMSTFIPPPPRNPSTIDLTLASPSIASLCDTRIFSDLCRSDHHPIEVLVNYLIKSIKTFSYKLNFTSSQWSEVKYFNDNAHSSSTLLTPTILSLNMIL